jgi:putative NADH-flavin reductase
MKKIALFGGTGSMGKYALELALSKGYEVRALVRNPEKVTTKNDRLTLIKGDVLIAEDVKKAVQGTDLVVSLFGHPFGKKNAVEAPDNLQTEGTRNIVAAMKKYEVERIISLSGGGVPFPEKDQPKLFPDKLIGFIMNTFFAKLIQDGINHVQVLEESGLKWMVVRGTRFVDEDKNGVYRVGWVGVNAGSKIGRKDLAHFVVSQLEDEQYNYQMPLISY